jgi:hypothetical protein
MEYWNTGMLFQKNNSIVPPFHHSKPIDVVSDFLLIVREVLP